MGDFGNSGYEAQKQVRKEIGNRPMDMKDFERIEQLQKEILDKRRATRRVIEDDQVLQKVQVTDVP